MDRREFLFNQTRLKTAKGNILGYESKKAECEAVVRASETKLREYADLLEFSAPNITEKVAVWHKNWLAQGQPQNMDWGGYFKTVTRPFYPTKDKMADYKLFQGAIRHAQAKLNLESMTAICDARIHGFRVRWAILEANLRSEVVIPTVDLEDLSREAGKVIRVFEQWKQECLATPEADFQKARVELNNIHFTQQRAPIGVGIDTNLRIIEDTINIADQAVEHAGAVGNRNHVPADTTTALRSFGEFEKDLLARHPLQNEIIELRQSAGHPRVVPPHPPQGGRI